jgi:hypothetical protein
MAGRVFREDWARVFVAIDLAAIAQICSKQDARDKEQGVT